MIAEKGIIWEKKQSAGAEYKKKSLRPRTGPNLIWGDGSDGMQAGEAERVRMGRDTALGR